MPIPVGFLQVLRRAWLYPVAIAACLMASLATSAEQGETTSVIVVGRVVDAATGAPVSGATVIPRLTGVTQAMTPVLTTASGDFLITGRVGDLRLSARHASYLDGGYGQRWPRDAELSLAITPGTQQLSVVIKLWRGGGFAGTVRDREGDPWINAEIRALTLDYVGGRTHLRSIASARTNDTGEYRLSGLAPGTYFALLVGDVGGRGRIRRPEVTFPSTYYPRSHVPSGAIPIEVTSGAVAPAINFVVTEEQVRDVTGEVSGIPSGCDGLWIDVWHVEEEPLVEVPLARVACGTDGTFVIPGLTNGEYVLEAVKFPNHKQAAAPSGTRVIHQLGRSELLGLRMEGSIPARFAPLATTETFWARQAIRPGPDPASRRVRLQFTRGTMATGHLEFKGSTPPPSSGQLAAAAVVFYPGNGSVLDMVPVTGVAVDGTFSTVELPPGSYVPRLVPPISRWTLLSVKLSGVERLGSGFDIGRTSAERIVLTFTDSPAVISGRVNDQEGQPSTDATVILFPTDATQWLDTGPSAYRVQQARPNGTGGYRFYGVPPGAYFLVAYRPTGPQRFGDPKQLQALSQTPMTARLVVAPAANITHDFRLGVRSSRH